MEERIDDLVAEAAQKLEAALARMDHQMALEQRRLVLLTLMRNAVILTTKASLMNETRMYVAASRALETTEPLH